ncbi:MAG: nodulation protein NfeD [Balneolaceae bacterium]
MNRQLSFALLLLLSGMTLALQQSETPARTEASEEAADERSVSVIRVEGTIGPTVYNYITRGLGLAQQRGDEALVIELDTPGGLLNSTQEIVQVMLGSSFPIIVYVSPDGANAGSAGTFITLAAHIAAMAPATNIGAASPVQMGGGEMDTVSRRKIFNFSESFIESIAERRGRNSEWAISAVRDGDAITATEALQIEVIDLIAEDLDDLLRQIDGWEIDDQTLATAGASINRIDRNLAERFFSFILRPEVMLILTMVAIYGIVGELTSPGAIIPGIAGVIALILLLYGVAAMPINVAGFILIAIALGLFVIEAFTPTYGVLLTGGAVSFFLGALMLFQDMPEEMQLSIYWLIPATILTVLFFAWIISYGIRAQYGEHRSGLEAAIGKEAKVVDEIGPDGGRVLFSGEYWNAESSDIIPEGAVCEIVSFRGLKVIVKAKNPSKPKGELS